MTASAFAAASPSVAQSPPGALLRAAVTRALAPENFPIRRSPPAAPRLEVRSEKPPTDLSAALAPLLERVRTDITAIKRKDGRQAWTHEPITPARIAAHLGAGTPRGVCPIKAGESTTMVGLLDLDSHEGETSWPDMVAAAKKVCTALGARGAHPIAFRSTGGKGIHIYSVWGEPQDAYSVRVFLRGALADAGYLDGTKGVSRSEIEVFPKQDSVPADGFGNQFILPLSGKSVPLDMTHGFEPMPREYALRVQWPASHPVAKEEKKIREPHAACAPSGDLVKLRSALAAIPNDGDGLGYDEWLRHIFGTHHATGGSPEGLEIAHEFSSRSTKYDPDFLDNSVWPHIKHDRENPITERTIYAEARKCGWREDSSTAFEPILEAEIAAQLGTPASTVQLATADQKQPTAESVPAAVPPSRFVAEHGSAFAVTTAAHWIVKGVLPAAELIVMYGESGSGKSFAALDMVGSIAEGTTWRGHKTNQGTVVYIPAEGAGGFRKRLVALAQHRGVNLADLPLYVIAATPNMLKRPDAIELIAAIRTVGAVSLIVLDTLASSTPGGDENSSESMGLAIAHCREIHKATGATVMLVHHAGKNASKGARGWSGLRAAADAEIEVSRDGANRTLTLTKQKDGEDNVAFGFTLVTVPIGLDEDGDVVSSCAVAHCEVAPRSKKSSEPDSTPKRLLLRLAAEMQGLDGSGPGREEWIKRAIEETDYEPAAGKRDRRRDIITRAADGLYADKRVRIEGGAVLLPEAA